MGAIDAGGVLRYIATQHGALHLDHVVRFTDPSEADASLALRSGDTRAIGYYLDHQRVHVASPDTATRQLLHAWQADIAYGRDALMLAPTREQVAALDAAARAARLDGHRPGRHIDLADGNHASTGDTVITRRNNRDLASSDTAWVRNGDRWRITRVRHDGSIDVQHLRNRNRLTLPAGYLAEPVELGYATTIHADTHVTPVDPGLLQPATATQLLETVISRDDAPASATTLLRQADQPELLLGPAATCYLDAITYAAEHHLTADIKAAIDPAATLHGLDRADAWPTLTAATSCSSPRTGTTPSMSSPGLLRSARSTRPATPRPSPTTGSTSPRPTTAPAAPSPGSSASPPSFSTTPPGRTTCPAAR